MRFVIFGNYYQHKKSQHAHHLIELLRKHGAEIYIDPEFYDFLVEEDQTDLSSVQLIQGDAFTADIVISLGGDGTFLRAASRVGNKGIPILGINTGRLGFLAAVAPEEMGIVLNEIHRANYCVEERSTLQLKIDNVQVPGFSHALNEIAILKRDSSSMIGVNTTINGEYLTTYQADGLIFSTATGSTAYSLSNGGPIIVPQSNTVSITPVAPHSLHMRPIVVPDDWEIKIKVFTRNHNFLVALDGRNYTCRDHSTLLIKKGDYSIRVVKRRQHDFFSTLRSKLGWGTDARI